MQGAGLPHYILVFVPLLFFELGEIFLFQNPVFKVAILWFWGILSLQDIVFGFEKSTYILW